MIILVLAFACSLVAAFLALWIIVPAPSYRFFEIAVGASEWSLWVGMLGLAGAFFSLKARAAGSNSFAVFVALAVGILAFVVSLVPHLSAWRVAHNQNYSLSLKEYIFGGADANSATVERKTLTFARFDTQALELDVYQLPISDAAKRPALIVVHGGSWNAGDKGDYPRWNNWLAAQGFVVFDIQYRLAQPNWRTATGDVKCAVRWVKEHATEFGIEAERIALLGRSAGGHLALLAAYTADNTQLPPSCGRDETRTDVRAVVSLYGPTDLVWGHEYPDNLRVLDGPAKIRAFLGGAPAMIPERFTLLSPVTHASSLAPTLLIHGGHDQLVGDEHTRRLVSRLQASNAPHHVIYLPYAQHAFDYNFNGWGSQLARQSLLDFLQRYLN